MFKEKNAVRNYENFKWQGWKEIIKMKKDGENVC